MTNVRKIRELFNYNQNEGNEEYDSEDDYQDQYLKSTQIDEDKKYEDEEPRIKINLEEIEERAPEEEESCISSLILSKEYQKSPKKYVNNILILRKLLKYKNILYYYFMRWKRLSNNVSLTKNFKILKRKQRMPMNEYIIGDAIITNDSIDSDKNDDNIKNSYNSEIRKEKILKNLKFFIEFNKSKKSIKKKYINRWREFVLKKEHEIEEIEQKYKNENLNIFENNNDIDDNYNNSIFNDNNFQSGTQRKELNVKKNEVINSKVNKEVRKSFRIGTVNNNFIIKFEDPENGNSISNTNLNNDNKKKEEKKEDNGSTNLNNNKNEEPPKEEPKKEEPPKEEPKKEEPPKEEPKKENMDEKKSNLPKEIYPKDEWDDEEFTWEENVVKPGFKRPCIVHRAIFGSLERFAAILIEHFGGKWPFWINPKQVSLCTVNDEVNDYTEKVYTELKLKGYQVEWDKSPGTLQKKIRNAQLAQFNYIFVIGKDEVKDQCVDIRTREGERLGKYSMHKVFELFKTLEPQMSNEEKELKEKIYKSDKNDKIIEAENKLIYNLYLEGDEVTEKDKELYKELENENILREEYPNLFKWKLLMKKNMSSS